MALEDHERKQMNVKSLETLPVWKTENYLYKSSAKSQETSLTRRESRSLLSSFSPSLKRASYGRSAETKSKMVCSFVLEMHIYTPVMNNYSVLILRLRSLRYGLFVWFP